MFKSIKKRPLRKRRHSSDSDEISDTEDSVKSNSSSLDELKEIQKLRQRSRGVNIEDLASVQREAKESAPDKDPFKMKTGGYIDVKALKKEGIKLEDAEQIGTSFAVETNRRDEDADMLKYVEEELAKRKGVSKEEIKSSVQSGSQEPFLYELPDNIKHIVSSKKKKEDMLSNQMLSGIPEVDLGIQAKICNIEATEEAKQRLMEERRRRNDPKEADFIPTNMAVNFMQHNRFNIEDELKPLLKKEEAPKIEPVRVGDAERPPTVKTEQKKGGKKEEKATDDFVFQKFKNKVKRI